jgi:hypothetical protein
MKIKSIHLIALLRLVLRTGLRLLMRDFLAPPPGAELGDFGASSLVAHA